MVTKYPLFIFAQDDHSMGIIYDESGLNHCEKPDIQDGLYVVWDRTGERLSLQWDDGSEKAALSQGYPDKENLLNSYKIYKCKYYNFKSKKNILCDFDEAESILGNL